MKLAILFWFHKDVDICLNRLRLLRRYNRGVPIFGLYGGEEAHEETFKARLGSYLDDFFTFKTDEGGEWKWLNADLLIADWHRQRGQFLPWDTVVVVQWDMLVLDSVSRIFSQLEEGEILLSGVRPVAEAPPGWYWITERGEQYRAFMEFMKAKFGNDVEPLCCLFLVACLPRRFLDQYINIQQPELGYLEYQIPTYARVFGIPFRKLEQFDSCWHDPQDKAVPARDLYLTASKDNIPRSVILYHLLRRNGSRVFHPFVHPFPTDVRSAVSFLLAMARGGRGRAHRD